jgi:hypothetical protein
MDTKATKGTKKKDNLSFFLGDLGGLGALRAGKPSVRGLLRRLVGISP